MTDSTASANLESGEADPARAGLPNPFRLTCVEKIEPPEGGEGRDWYRYVIESGGSKITGQRRGSLEDVTAYAAQSTEQLNARGLKSRSMWTSRSKKAG